jgi:hypothetical protein
MSGGPGESDPTELADKVFRVLSDDYRRCVLYYLLDRESATVDELATVLTGWTQAREDAFEIATPDDRTRVRAKLHHVYLPRIDGAGFVHYEYDSGEVELETVPDMLDAVLERALEGDRRADEHRHAAGDRPGRGDENRPDRDRTVRDRTDEDCSEDP